MPQPAPACESNTYATFLANRTVLGGRHSRLQWDSEGNIIIYLITGFNAVGVYNEVQIFKTKVTDLAKVQMSSQFMTFIPKYGRKVIVLLKSSTPVEAFLIMSASAREQFLKNNPAPTTAEWKEALTASGVPVQRRRSATYLLNQTGPGLPTAAAVFALAIAGHKLWLRKKV